MTRRKGFWDDPEVILLAEQHRPLMGGIEPKASDHEGLAHCPCPIAVRVREIEEQYRQQRLEAKPVLSAGKRLELIAAIIEGVDQRCSANDGPVSTTKEEITAAEIIEIYRLASGKIPRKREKDKERA